MSLGLVVVHVLIDVLTTRRLLLYYLVLCEELSLFLIKMLCI